MIKKILFLILYFLSPVIPIFTIYSNNPNLYSESRYLIPMVLGSVAYTWLNFELILSARPKFIESSFGLDKFFRLHSLMAVIAIVFALIHKLFEEDVFGDDGFQANIGSIALIIFIVAAALALFFIIDTFIKLFKPLSRIRKLLRTYQIGKYQIQVILHNATVIAVVVLFVHVMLTRSAKKPMVMAIYILYFGISMCFYLYHKVIRRYLTAKMFVITDLKNENSLMSTLILKPLKGEVFNYTAGQFAFLRVFSNNVTQEEHPFSISSEPTNKESVTLTIKNLGDWTSLVSNFKVGDKVTLDAPYGKFGPLFHKSNKTIILIAGGVGITPMLSILRYLYKNDKEQNVILFWGVNDTKEIICKEEFDKFEKEMNNFKLILVVANDKTFQGEQGYISREKIERVISENGYNIFQSKFFLCGPPPMQKSVLKTLKELHVKNKDINYESFSL